MNIKVIREWLIWIAVGGVLVVGYLLATDKRTEKASQTTFDAEKRLEKRKAVVAAGPIVKVLPTTEGDVIEVAIPSLRRGRFLEIRHCTVWRDIRTKTTAMSCAEEETSSDYEIGEPPRYAD